METAGTNGKLVLPTLVFTRFISSTPSVLTGLLLLDISLSLDSPVGVTGQIRTASSIVALIAALAHPLWGADLSISNPTAGEIQVGYDALEVVGHPTEYARLDMIPAKKGPIIIEVELIEPFLFFDILPDTVNAFAEHIKNGIKA